MEFQVSRQQVVMTSLDYQCSTSSDNLLCGTAMVPEGLNFIQAENCSKNNPFVFFFTNRWIKFWQAMMTDIDCGMPVFPIA